MRLHLNLLSLAIVSLVLLTSMSSVVASQDSLGPKITIQQTSGEKCILPPEEMRRQHPDLLKHDRIATLREGVRAKADGGKLDGSLKQCVNCHAIKDDSNKYVRIDNDQHFCVSCHKYAAVSIDCFQCHRDIPEGGGDFHTLSNHKGINYNAVVPGTYNLTVQDMANIVPEGYSDDK
ncbi:MAG: hypothetical protein KAI02_00890 [Gammaproteobacteria bacterium]|nr:hypothetical protein [Gammaproteobacteria bacterium]